MHRNRNTRLVYSTDSDIIPDQDSPEEQSLVPGEQNLRIWKERRGGGKVVTLIRGFVGANKELKILGRTLKQFCGAGGTVKDGEIIIQGDFREKIRTELDRLGYRVKLSGG
ncbi:MAG: translation initiation factor [FCB group bacterium]|nr:translation initiation factor [FCB group bacterium]